MRLARISWMLLSALLLAGPVAGADWPRFRGPDGLGVSDDAKVPTTWGEKKNLKWKLSLPGGGMSSPIVVGNKVFVTGYTSDGGTKRHLVCVDRAKGSMLWTKTISSSGNEGSSRGGRMGFHGFASHTPVSDGERVYVFFGSSGVIAFDMEGKELWKQSVGTGSNAVFGSASSPIMWKDLVIVAACSESTSLYGFDKKHGKQVWKENAGSLRSSYSTPSIVKNKNGEDELLVSVTDEVWGMNPANGKLKWYLSTNVDTAANTVLVTDGDIVYSVGGKGGWRTAFKVGGKDDVSKSNTVWSKGGGSYVGSPVLYKGHLYWVNQNGTAYCVDARTGVQVESKRLGGQHYASVVVIKDKLYALSRSGTAYVLEASPKLTEIAQNKFSDSSDFSGTPAVSDGQLFIRSDKFLYCIQAD